MRILVVGDKESKSLWDYFQPEKLEGVDLIISVGDLDPSLLSFLATFTHAPVFVGGTEAKTAYDPERNALCFQVESSRNIREITVSFPDAETAQDDWMERTRQRLQRLQTDNDEKTRIWKVLNRGKRSVALLGTLENICITPGIVSCLSETIFGEE